jgi:hypothetical protein
MRAGAFLILPNAVHLLVSFEQCLPKKNRADSMPARLMIKQ